MAGPPGPQPVIRHPKIYVYEKTLYLSLLRPLRGNRKCRPSRRHFTRSAGTCRQYRRPRQNRQAGDHLFLRDLV